MNGHPSKLAAQQPDQVGVGVMPGSSGKPSPVLVVNGRPIMLDPDQARQLGVSLIQGAAVCSIPTEELRKLLLAAESGLVLPGGVRLPATPADPQKGS
jgi:hypothetical protein